MARTMTLNDGTELQVRACGEDEGLLGFVALGDHALLEMVALLSRPEATEHIEVKGVELVNVYDGYTELVMISSIMYADGIYATLRKGAS